MERSEDILSTTGAHIRQARTAARLNLAQLARLTGISPAALSLIETGQRDLRLTTLNRIANALRVPLGSLMDNATAETDLPEDGMTRVGSGHDLGEFME